MTTFQTDSIVELTNIPGFNAIMWLCAGIIIGGIILTFAYDNGWWLGGALLLAGIGFFANIDANHAQRTEQRERMEKVLEVELQEAGFHDAEVGYLNNTKTGDGFKFRYAEDNKILDCELIAGPEHGVFKVACF